MNINWDADKYTQDFAFVHQYGAGVAELIDAPAGSTVLDLGCGNGALSKTLQEKGFVVTGMDDSGELLNIAGQNYPELQFIRANAVNFHLEKPMDVIFSNAVFHWIEKEKQEDMLACVHAALKEGGQFVFEFGGYENNRLIHGALAEAFADRGFEYRMPFYFPTIGEYSASLEKTGFKVVYAVLFDRPTELLGEDGLKDWINMFVKTPFSMIEDETLRHTIIDKAVERLRPVLYRDGKWYADYVRIRMKAIRL